jgi:hypothetical protein
MDYYDINYELTYDLTDNDDINYQKDILKCFKIDKYDMTSISNGIEKMCEFLKNDINLKNLLNKSSSIVLSNELEIGLVILFSFDYLIYFHKLLKIYISKSVIDDDLYEKINLKLLKKI